MKIAQDAVKLQMDMQGAIVQSDWEGKLSKKGLENLQTAVKKIKDSEAELDAALATVDALHALFYLCNTYGWNIEMLFMEVHVEFMTEKRSEDLEKIIADKYKPSIQAIQAMNALKRGYVQRTKEIDALKKENEQLKAKLKAAGA